MSWRTEKALGEGEDENGETEKEGVEEVVKKEPKFLVESLAVPLLMIWRIIVLLLVGFSCLSLVCLCRGKTSFSNNKR